MINQRGAKDRFWTHSVVSSNKCGIGPLCSPFNFCYQSRYHFSYLRTSPLYKTRCQQYRLESQQFKQLPTVYFNFLIFFRHLHPIFELLPLFSNFPYFPFTAKKFNDFCSLVLRFDVEKGLTTHVEKCTSTKTVLELQLSKSSRYAANLIVYVWKVASDV